MIYLCIVGLFLKHFGKSMSQMVNSQTQIVEKRIFALAACLRENNLPSKYE